MIHLITDNLEAIHALCRMHGVRQLDLYGSAATGAFDPATSDVDFVVDLGDYTPGTDFRYLDLVLGLESLLGYPVQIITEPSIRPDYFRQAIDAQRVNVYASGDRQQAA